MRKVWVWVLGVGLVLGTSVCAMPWSLCDYQSPETNLTDMRLSFSYRYLDNPTAEGAEVNAGRIGVDFDQISDSADMGFSLSGSVEVSMVDFTPSDALGQAAGTFRYYITDEMPIFAFGGLEGSMTTGRLQPGVQVRAGMGYGRFSDVTPLAKAFAIQDALLDLGAIGDALPDDVLMGLAEAIGRDHRVRGTQGPRRGYRGTDRGHRACRTRCARAAQHRRGDPGRRGRPQLRLGRPGWLRVRAARPERGGSRSSDRRVGRRRLRARLGGAISPARQRIGSLRHPRGERVDRTGFVRAHPQ